MTDSDKAQFRTPQTDIHEDGLAGKNQPIVAVGEKKGGYMEVQPP